MAKLVVKSVRPILPFPSHSNSLDTFLVWLRDKVQASEYAKVGLTVIVHDHKVVRIEKHEDISCKMEE